MELVIIALIAVEVVIVRRNTLYGPPGANVA